MQISLENQWKCERSFWPTHRPVVSELAIGPLRLKRPVPPEEADRVVERRRAQAFLDSQRRRAG